MNKTLALFFTTTLIAACTASELQKNRNVKEKLTLEKIDRNMGTGKKSVSPLDWYTVDAENFELSGLYFRNPGEPFRRIPLDASVSRGVDHLAGNTAGVMLRFKSDANEITIDVKLDRDIPNDNMSAGVTKGFDIYTGSGSSKFFRRITRFPAVAKEYKSILFQADGPKKIREFTIHFPLYSHPIDLKIGLSKGAKILPPTPWKDPRPVVVYGTSIQQGGCASRPGMAHTNIMSRMLNRPFINLGFSGSGRGEPEMAKIMAKIKNPAMFILDYDANAGVAGLQKTLSGFVDILRKAHPEVPILLVSRLPYAREFGENPEYSSVRYQFTTIHLNELNRRRQQGDNNIHFLDGSSLYGMDPTECTVDGVHASDLGFWQISKRMAPVIERILTAL